ncbi:MotA/TolQ/ExbB proton channel family protein [Maribellus luteus]|uniref:MotA/TolQ/ExbB proton channel family protein n=1 Tax=Maribellus luteus TaxID=2305463 RepID=A0A399T002_9BACT|nr:MotA/TolQ/ExbB proton channel family protein [Maribellus luteus]RIJ49088.1 MotA/TolQ/ExbB proton channel family protein [Maribellus luteus]
MKRLFALIAVFGMLFFMASNVALAQDEPAATPEATAQQVDQTVDQEEQAAAAAEEGKSLHSQLKQKFIEGGPTFMSFVLITLILGLAFAIERVLYLNLATSNTKKLLAKVEEALENGGVEAAKDVCRNTRGPVASIFYQGLDRFDHGIDVVEKTVISYGSVQAGLLEKGLSWIALFIALAPMLGFMGTVIGMISAFDAIEVAGDISPSLVANGIKIALITTVTGLIVAIILQIFYNYCVAKIDSIINNMEDASISLLDLLVKHNMKK